MFNLVVRVFILYVLELSLFPKSVNLFRMFHTIDIWDTIYLMNFNNSGFPGWTKLKLSVKWIVSLSIENSENTVWLEKLFAKYNKNTVMLNLKLKKKTFMTNLKLKKNTIMLNLK